MKNILEQTPITRDSITQKILNHIYSYRILRVLNNSTKASRQKLIWWKTSNFSQRSYDRNISRRVVIFLCASNIVCKMIKHFPLYKLALYIK